MTEGQKFQECPNCGHELADSDNFCPNCGQRNLDRNVFVGQLFKEFLGDYFTFDSKLFHSLVPLLFKPGKMTFEFNQGKRERYIPPLRLFIFSSVILFFIISLDFSNDKQEGNLVNIRTGTQAEIDSIKKIDNKMINLNFTDDSTGSNVFQNITEMAKTHTPAEVADSIIKEKSFFRKTLIKQYVKLVQSEGKALRNFILQNGTIILLLIMPVFAFLLKLLYFRREKLYIHHLVFSLHFHAFFIILLILMQIIHAFTGFYSFWPVFILLFIYLFLAMRRNYGQSNTKTFWKELLLISAYWTVLMPILLITLMVSFFIF